MEGGEGGGGRQRRSGGAPRARASPASAFAERAGRRQRQRSKGAEPARPCTRATRANTPDGWAAAAVARANRGRRRRRRRRRNASRRRVRRRDRRRGRRLAAAPPRVRSPFSPQSSKLEAGARARARARPTHTQRTPSSQGCVQGLSASRLAPPPHLSRQMRPFRHAPSPSACAHRSSSIWPFALQSAARAAPGPSPPRARTPQPSWRSRTDGAGALISSA